MSVQEVKAAVEAMDPLQRKQFTSWILRRYPTIRVEDLLQSARHQVESGEWMPTPPTEDNIPTGDARTHAADTVRRLGLDAKF